MSKIQDFLWIKKEENDIWELPTKGCKYLYCLFWNNIYLFFISLYIFHRIDIFYTKIWDTKLKLYPSHYIHHVITNLTVTLLNLLIIYLCIRRSYYEK